MSTATDRCRVVAWNLERKKPSAPRGAEALDVVFATAADLMVLTETRTTIDPRGGHVLAAPVAPRGRRFAADERKVVAWSKRPWRGVDIVDLGSIDRSRTVSGTTDTTIGAVTVLAVCIPWHMAGVTTGDGPKRSPWELHLAYLEELAAILPLCPRPLIVAGDFNQRIPRSKGASRAAADALEACFAELSILTSGRLDGCDRPGIDHIACSPDLSATRTWGWRRDATGRRLSDHDGAGAELRRHPVSAGRRA